jgi:hypothetical protein
MGNKKYEKQKESQKRYRENNKNFIKKLGKEARDNIRFGGNREKALERDNWTCQDCGMNNEQHILIFGRGISVDHIDGNGRDSKNPNNDLENLITRCLRCHGKKDILRRKIINK